jgi:hypothetical protein
MASQRYSSRLVSFLQQFGRMQSGFRNQGVVVIRAENSCLLEPTNDERNCLQLSLALRDGLLVDRKAFKRPLEPNDGKSCAVDSPLSRELICQFFHARLIRRLKSKKIKP